MKSFANKFNFSSTILQGIRVLDLSRILVGPLASQMLSDMGAEVIKIESFSGDETRNWGPPFNNSTSTYFLALNRNKKSISIDLAQDEGKKIIYVNKNFINYILLYRIGSFY